MMTFSCAPTTTTYYFMNAIQQNTNNYDYLLLFWKIKCLKKIVFKD